MKNLKRKSSQVIENARRPFSSRLVARDPSATASAPPSIMGDHGMEDTASTSSPRPVPSTISTCTQGPFPERQFNVAGSRAEPQPSTASEGFIDRNSSPSNPAASTSFLPVDTVLGSKGIPLPVSTDGHSSHIRPSSSSHSQLANILQSPVPPNLSSPTVVAPHALNSYSATRSVASTGVNQQTPPTVLVSPPVANQNPNSTRLTTPTSGAQPSLWMSASNRLSLEDKNSFASLDPNNQDYSIEIIRHIEKHRDLCQQKKWKFNFRGKDIVLRDVVDKLLAWVDRFKNIGDIIIQYDPGHAALPWACVRFLLQLSICDKETMGVIITGVEMVSRLLVRCSVYENLYLRSASPMVLAGLQEALIVLYTAILEFLACAKRYLTQKITTRVLRTLLVLDGTSSLFDAIGEKERLVEREIVAAEREIQRSHQSSVQGNHHELKLFLKGLEEPIIRIDGNVSKLHFETREYIRGEKRLAILNWLSKMEYKKHHDQAKEGIVENTGQWLLAHKEYRKWRSTSASGILWLHGIPGAGKTKLTCTVIETLISQLGGQEPVVHFYCNKNDPQRQDPTILMQAILKQLSVAFPGLPKAIVAEYNKRLEDGLAAGSLSFEQCRDLIISLLDLYPQTTIVIDALDECDPDERWRLLEVLKILLESVGSLVKIFVSSRDDMDITLQLKGLPNLYIDAKETSRDILRFVEREIKGSIKNKRLLRGNASKELEEYIISTIGQKAQGMFQWADLQIKSLYRLKLASEVQERLTMLPQTLEETYSNILTEIGQGTPNERNLAEKSLMWILASQSPLDRQQWAEFSHWPKRVPEDGVDCLFQLCRNLVTWDSQLNRVIFAHLSVQEYLEKTWLNEKRDFHSKAALNCLSALSCPSSIVMTRNLYELIEPTDDIDTGGFVCYSVFYWFEHVERSVSNEGSLDPSLNSFLLGFLGTSERTGEVYLRWALFFRILAGQDAWGGRWDPHMTSRRCRLPMKMTPNPYFLIAHCRFGSKFTEEFPIASRHIDDTNCSGQTTFAIAAEAGNLWVMDQLHSRNADINKADNNDFTPLCLAIWNNQVAAVLKLLDMGAQLGRRKNRTIMEVAARKGSTQLMSCLLSRDETLEITTAVLKAAVSNRSEGKKMLEFLLDRYEGAVPTDEILIEAEIVLVARELFKC